MEKIKHIFDLGNNTIIRFQTGNNGVVLTMESDLCAIGIALTRPDVVRELGELLVSASENM